MPIRALRAEELAEVEKVFGGGLDITRVRVSEGSAIPNKIGRIGAFFRHTAPPALNAITVRNISYFPVTLVTNDVRHGNYLRDMGWLMHELTHQWQYQHDGLVYLFQAVFLSPTYVYAPPGEPVDVALKDFCKAGKVFRNFNREQQGDIVRDYYFHLAQNADVSAWEAYLTEIRQPLRKEPQRDVAA